MLDGRRGLHEELVDDLGTLLLGILTFEGTKEFFV